MHKITDFVLRQACIEKWTKQKLIEITAYSFWEASDCLDSIELVDVQTEVFWSAATTAGHQFTTLAQHSRIPTYTVRWTSSLVNVMYLVPVHNWIPLLPTSTCCFAVICEFSDNKWCIAISHSACRMVIFKNRWVTEVIMWSLLQ